MDFEEKIAEAVDNRFGYVITTDGENITGIKNLDNYSPILGKHLNERRMNLVLTGDESVDEIAGDIFVKWGI